MLRKIKAATRDFIAKKKLPSLIQFETSAVIRNSTSRNSPKVQAAIKTALAEIEKALSL